MRAKARLVEQNARPGQISLFLNVLRDEKRLGLQSLDEVAFLSIQLIMGAADTSRMSTWSFMEAMMMFPDVQAEAQAQIDRVVSDRIPVWEYPVCKMFDEGAVEVETAGCVGASAHDAEGPGVWRHADPEGVADSS